MKFSKRISPRLFFRGRLNARHVAVFCSMIVGGLILAFWPDAAIADDCLRDPYNAEDCLRTSGWAPVMAGGIVWLTSIFTSLGEVGNTIRASSAATAAQAGGWWDNFSIRKLFPNAPFFQDTMDKIYDARKHIAQETKQDPSAIDREREANRRSTSQGEKSSLPWRIICAVGGGLIAAVAIKVSIPAILLGGLIGLIVPDAITFVEGFMLNRKK